jgi:hypothetical protein
MTPLSVGVAPREHLGGFFGCSASEALHSPCPCSVGHFSELGWNAGNGHRHLCRPTTLRQAHVDHQGGSGNSSPLKIAYSRSLMFNSRSDGRCGVSHAQVKETWSLLSSRTVHDRAPGVDVARLAKAHRNLFLTARASDTDPRDRSPPSDRLATIS